MVSLKFTLLAATTFGLASAHPNPTPAAAAYFNPPVNCAKIDGALIVLKNLGPPATSFCSSYLKIPKTATTTIFSTPLTTVTTATVTTTTNYLPEGCAIQKRHSPRGYKGYPFAEPANDFLVKPRGSETLAERHDQLAGLAKFAAAKVSEGCRCLGIEAKGTTTVTQTGPTSTVDVIATRTVCDNR